MTTTGAVHPEFARWAAEQARAQSEDSAESQDSAESDQAANNDLFVNSKDLTRLVNVTAKMASGFFRPTKRTEVVWTEADSELLVSIDEVETEVSDGLVLIKIPVRCDETGPTSVIVPFAVGRDEFPAGSYASSLRRPVGPELIVDVWGDALVAFGWQMLLTLFIQVAGVAGKDPRGSRFVPGVVSATANGLRVRPIERHRFFGSTGLLDKRRG